MKPLRIYLADLTHVGNGVATEAFPLNIGVIASYALQKFGKDVDIQLFKYPEDLKEAIANQPPHLLGCSNYAWNSNLSYYFCKLVKLLGETITVFGGTNYPFESVNQEAFLRARPALDLHIYYEGEQVFTSLVERILSVDSVSKVFDDPIPSCQFVHPQTGSFVSGESLPRIKDLDTIPSPYVNGLLDKFFDGNLTPLVETARGCPFRCNFCNAGDIYFNSVNQFSNAYVEEELTYVAERAAKAGVGHVTFADNNFGMIPRDARTAEVVSSLQEKHGWPKSISVWTGKNSKERVIDVTRLLGETLSISMSTQSMDDTVLQEIGRSNIKLDHYNRIADELNAQGRPQHAEVIMPLPLETLESHIQGLNDLLDTNVSRVLSHTLQLLHGTPYKDDPVYREANGYDARYRVVPMDFSTVNGEPIFDVEEVGVATKDFPFKDYVEARKYTLVIDACYNSGIFDPLRHYLRQLGIANSQWIQSVYGQISEFPVTIGQVFDSFEEETKSELWDTEGDLIAHYSQPENYQKLIDYEQGGNVLFKHRVWILARLSEEWVDTIFRCTERLLDKVGMQEEVKRELDALKVFIKLRVVDSLSESSADTALTDEFDFDIPSWLGQAKPLSSFGLESPSELTFQLNERAAAILRDAVKRYGTGIAGLVKMVQRTAGISFCREVSYANQIGGYTTATNQFGSGPGASSI